VDIPNLKGNKKTFSPLFSSSSISVRIGTSTIVLAVILIASNIPIGIAQGQQLASQPSVVGNEIVPRTAQSKEDSFKVQIPSGWIIQDINNTGPALGIEALQGYGILAQLCPAEEQGGMHSNSNGGTNGSIDASTISTGNSCQGAQKEVIHIIRYPNLGARLALTDEDFASRPSDVSDTVLAYQMQKLVEVGYRDIRIVNTTDTKISLDLTIALDNNIRTATVPGKLVEMTYSTNLVPNETRRGYFVSIATDATPRNLGTITGYGIFYEGAILNGATPGEEEGQAKIMQTGSLVLAPLTPVSQVFDSFELIAGPELVQSILDAQAAAQEAEEVQATEEEAVDPLTVNIDSNGTEGVTPATFEFEADITGGTEPYTIIWDLNEDEVAESNEQTLVVSFNEAGTYDVEVVVADIGGQVTSDTIEITIEEGEEAPIEDELPGEGILEEEIGNTQQPGLDDDSQGIGGILDRAIEGFSNSSLF
jgi:hypothetical protein